MIPLKLKLKLKKRCLSPKSLFYLDRDSICTCAPFLPCSIPIQKSLLLPQGNHRRIKRNRQERPKNSLSPRLHRSRPRALERAVHQQKPPLAARGGRDVLVSVGRHGPQRGRAARRAEDAGAQDLVDGEAGPRRQYDGQEVGRPRGAVAVRLLVRVQAPGRRGEAGLQLERGAPGRGRLGLLRRRDGEADHLRRDVVRLVILVVLVFAELGLVVPDDGVWEGRDGDSGHAQDAADVLRAAVCSAIHAVEVGQRRIRDAEAVVGPEQVCFGDFGAVPGQHEAAQLVHGILEAQGGSRLGVAGQCALDAIYAVERQERQAVRGKEDFVLDERALDELMRRAARCRFYDGREPLGTAKKHISLLHFRARNSTPAQTYPVPKAFSARIRVSRSVFFAPEDRSHACMRRRPNELAGIELVVSVVVVDDAVQGVMGGGDSGVAGDIGHLDLVAPISCSGGDENMGTL